MDPEKMRQCMSLGYSAKSKIANTIGQCKSPSLISKRWPFFKEPWHIICGFFFCVYFFIRWKWF